MDSVLSTCLLERSNYLLEGVTFFKCSAQPHRGGGGNSYIKWTGVLVVSFRGFQSGFSKGPPRDLLWYLLGY